KPDLIVHNDLHDIEVGRHPFSLWHSNGDSSLKSSIELKSRVDSARELAARVDEWLSGGSV
ncbi:MAG: hypothetical protein AAB250_11900, partial [Bdellovibrionota bacterium]